MCHRSSHYAVHDDCEAAIAPRLLHPSDGCHDGATLPPTRWVPYSTAITKRPIEGIARHCHDGDLPCIVAKRRLQDSFTSVIPVASLTAGTPLCEVDRYRTYSDRKYVVSSGKLRDQLSRQKRSRTQKLSKFDLVSCVYRASSSKSVCTCKIERGERLL